MKAIILAAGMGSRLGQRAQPKVLTRLASGRSILEQQLYALSHYISLDQVIVVIGYHKEQILEQCPDLLYVYNPDYAIENTAKSLLRAVKKWDEDIIWLNGDLVFHHSVLETILSSHKSCMLVNTAPVGEEEVKYSADTQGRILRVSKSVSPALGEALGINLCRKKDLPSLKRNLAKCSASDYFERAIELCIDEGTAFWSIPIEAHLCTEIDFPEDLTRANTLLGAF